MRAGRCEVWAWCALLAFGTGACSLLTSLDDLGSSTDAGTDAPTSDGDSSNGGDADSAPDVFVPPSSAVAITAGGQLLTATTGAHACAIVGIDHSIYCWGANDHGQLGNGASGADQATPVKILTDDVTSPFTAVDDVTAGSWNTCARKGTQMYCWGQRVGGGVGDGQISTTDKTAPHNVTGSVATIATGGEHACFISSAVKAASCFGTNHSEQLGHTLDTMGDVACNPFYESSASVCNPAVVTAMFSGAAAAISAGTLHTCVLTTAGGVQCWGYQGECATGGGGTVSTPSPVVVMRTGSTPLVLTKLRSTARHNCGIDSSNAVWCWGQNDTGQCGQTPAGCIATATQVPSLAASDVAVGEHASCALTTAGDVVCWGDDTYGQLGDGAKQATFTPQTVKGPNGTGKLAGVTSLALGYGFACALTTDKSVYCWGHNDRGELGDGTTQDRAFPVRVLIP